MTVIALVLALGAGGCAQAKLNAARRNVAGNRASSHAMIPAVSGIVMAVSDGHERLNPSEALAAAGRAQATLDAIYSAREELLSGGFDKKQHAEKAREIGRLQKKYQDEVARLDAFSRQVERHGEERERLIELKDPVIERLRAELVSILEHKGANEAAEVERVRREMARRREEVAQE